MPGYIDGRAANMLIDTGADVTLAHERIVTPNLPFMRKYNRKLAGVTGGTLVVLGSIDLKIKLHEDAANHEVVVVEDIPYDVIIGRDFLEKENYTIKFSPPTPGRPREQLAGVRLNKQIEIPASSKKYLQLRMTRSLDHCKEARVRPVQQSTPGVWVEDAVSDITPEGKITVCIVNANPYRVTMERRTRLADVASYANATVNHIRVSDWLDEKISNVTASHDAKQSMVEAPSRPPRMTKSTRAEAVLKLMDLTALSRNQRAIVERLVRKAPHCFSLEGEPLPATPLVEYSIPTGDAAPVRKRAYRLPECHRDPLKKIIKRLRAEEIIQPSTSDWSAPVLVLPKKKPGEYRLVVDHRGLNEVLRKDSYPLPRIDDLLDLLKAAKVFSVLDLRSGFHQIKVRKEDRHKTAFVCAEGLFEYLRLSMGMANAPSCFQRLLETIFADMASEGVLVYIDDLILFSNTEAEHEILLEKVLGRLEAAKLSLRPDKCDLFRSQVRYLGHLVSAEGIYPLHENVKNVKHFPVPTDVHTLRRFIGLASYYRRFVKGFASIAKPLTDLTKKNNAWVWGQPERHAFETLKAKLIAPPILAYPRYDSPFKLTTDASDWCLGSVLSQVQEGVERVIAYGSRCLTAAEKNYSTTEKECLSIVHFLGEYRHYLLGRHFIVESDHAPLSLLNQRGKEPKGRLGRWQLQLSEFDFEVRYRPGRVITNADTMSRLPASAVNNIGVMNGDLDSEDEAEAELDGSLAAPKIKIAQQKDEFCRQMINYLRRQELPPTNDRLAKRIVLEADQFLLRGDGILTHLPNPKVSASPGIGMNPVIVLPEPLRGAALGLLHDHFSGGHFGFQKTLRKVQERFYWPRMYTDIDNYTRSCTSCARVKTPPVRRRAPHATYSRATAPLDCVEMDIVGEISPPSNGCKVILVVTDLFTKFAEAYPLENQKAPLIARTLVNEFFSRYGCPNVIRSDRGKNFLASVVKEVCKLYKIKRVVGSSYHPESQGGVERQNRTLVETLKHYTQTDVFNWAEYIPHAVLAYNTSVHATTLHSPFSLFFGRTARLPLDGMTRQPPPNYRGVDGYREELARRLHLTYQTASINSQAALDAQKKQYDKRASKRDFRVGDRVYITNEQKKAKRKSKDDCRKFRMSWLGPCEIILKKGEVTYTVKHLDSGKREVVHENRLKLAYPARDASIDPEPAGEPSTPTRGKTKKRPEPSDRQLRSKEHILASEEDSDSEDDTDSEEDMEVESDNASADDATDHEGDGNESNQHDDSDASSLSESPSDEGTGAVGGSDSAEAESGVTTNSRVAGSQGGGDTTTAAAQVPAPKVTPPPGESVGDRPGRPKDSQSPRRDPEEATTKGPSPGVANTGVANNGGVSKRKRGRPRGDRPVPTDAIPIARRQGLKTRFNHDWSEKLALDRAKGKWHNVDLYKVLGSEQPNPLEHDFVVGLKQAAERNYGPPQSSGAPPRRSARASEGGQPKIRVVQTAPLSPSTTRYERGQVTNCWYIRDY